MPQPNYEADELRRGNRRQFASDLLRNAAGVPGAALSMGTGMVAQAGAGLGTLAGMTADALRKTGRLTSLDPQAIEQFKQHGWSSLAPDMDAAAETVQGHGGQLHLCPGQ